MISAVRIAIRSLARRPAVAAVAIVSLAVGISVNAAVFSIVDAIFLRPPAVQHPEDLVEVAGNFKDSGDAVLDWSDCEDIGREIPAFSTTTPSMGRGGLWRDRDEMTLLLVYMVGDNYFDMLGVKPFIGHWPAAQDPEPALVLAYWFWRERMGGRADIIGQRMEFRDHIWRIAAVLPPQFRGLSPLDQRHVWITASSWARYYPSDLQRGSGQFTVLARLRPGVPLAQAQVQLAALAKRIENSDSHVQKGRRLVAHSIAREMQSRLRPGILVMTIVALVLLVACANVAAVLLAHAEARRREIGMRLALGASRRALVRQFLTESAVLTFAGAAAGLLLAAWLLSLVPLLAPPSVVPLNFDFRMDLRLLLFLAGCVVVTLVIFGFAPLLYAVRVSLIEAITGSRVTGRSRRSWLRYALVTGQVALCVMLVGGAVVLLRALGDAKQIYPGFEASRPLVLLSGNNRGSKPDSMAFNEAAGRMAAVGGVEAVTYARHLPLTDSGGGARIPVTPEGAAPDAAPPQIYFNLVGPKFFEVTGMRMISGRIFADSDQQGPPVAIINAEAARRFWPGQNPLGKVLRAQQQIYQVVGVAADGRIGSLHEAPAPAVYLPASRIEWGEAILIARTKPDPATLRKELVRAAAKTNELRIYESTTLRTLWTQALYEDWIPTVLGGMLAMVGLLLAAVGLYGAVSYATEQRLSEFGVRIAVGARTSQIAALVLRQAAMLCAAGVPAGVGLFLGAYHYYGAALLRNRPVDPPAIGAGAVIAVIAVLAGAVLPAMRAARLDPVEVLRAQ